MSDINRLEKSGPKYYKTNTLENAQYDHVQQACCAVGQNLLDQATDEIKAGRIADPHNPLFDYLQATVELRKKNLSSAMHLIDLGNSKGAMRVYTTNVLPPNRWQWPESGMIVSMGKCIARKSSADKDALISVLKMGQKVIWRKPQDPLSLMMGLKLRDTAAKNLLCLSEKSGDKWHAKLYKDLIIESQQACHDIKKQKWIDSFFCEDSREWIIGKAMQGQNEHFRDLAMLLYLEKQATKTDHLRSKYLKTRVDL